MRRVELVHFWARRVRPSVLSSRCNQKALFSEPLWSHRLWLMQTVRILSSLRAQMLHLNSFKNIFELLPRCCAQNTLLSKEWCRWSCSGDSDGVLYTFHRLPALRVIQWRAQRNCSYNCSACKYSRKRYGRAMIAFIIFKILMSYTQLITCAWLLAALTEQSEKCPLNQRRN